ncbi:ABC transporter substrate-binding protein [Piscinibacter terrae]|uniref:Probable sugar-binding periplasmic protein n=1 Tax=Piscinibacter terrae TaxID=2496871 RepID=A0A3N7HMA8_9BURK|nr:ABC transporter substrate-binding protein [Albitalea terrae]RQP21761.1 carbohydrate ABC transporter substrate-binding protein [Albitalea terrae]
MKKISSLVVGALCGACVMAAQAASEDIEIMHWWTSGGEAKALDELKSRLKGAGYRWKDMAVEGGGGDKAMETLQARVSRGQPPEAAQMNGASIQSWGRQKALANLDAVAKEQQWESQIPAVVTRGLKVDGHFVAAPFNIHRANWLWINRDAFVKYAGRTPETWDQFFVMADRMKTAGILPIAHGSQPWQNFALFETVLLGVGGVDTYRRALIALDNEAIQSPKVEEALKVFRRLKSYTDGAAANDRNWNAATAMVVNNKAAMQFMGDWAKGEFFAAGKAADRDFLCIAPPGTQRSFLFIVDSFAVFKKGADEATAAQKTLARLIMTPSFQQAFNLAKGSVPLSANVDMAKFDVCGQQSSAYFVATSMVDTLVPSVAFHMALPVEQETALKNLVSEFWSNDAMPVAEAVRRIQRIRAIGTKDQH